MRLLPQCVRILLNASELLRYHRGLISGRTFVVLVSQSGEIVEGVRLLDAIHGQAAVMSITNEDASSIARRSDLSLPLLAGREVGFYSASPSSSTASPSRPAYNCRPSRVS